MSDLLKRIDEAHFALLNGMNHEKLDVLLRDCRAEIERLSKPYVPMTDDEISIMMAEWYDDDEAPPSSNAPDLRLNMTDLRTAAQTVIDAFARREADDDGREVIPIHAVFANIEALRQALAAPVEPVAWLHHIVDPDGFVADMRVSFSNHSILNEISREPLYTTPPSVDALIAEAVAKEREECAQICDGREDMLADKLANEIRARGQK